MIDRAKVVIFGLNLYWFHHLCLYVAKSATFLIFLQHETSEHWFGLEKKLER